MEVKVVFDNSFLKVYSHRSSPSLTSQTFLLSAYYSLAKIDDGLSQITLHRIEVNDVTLTHLHIRDTQSSNFGIGSGTFNSETFANSVTQSGKIRI